MLLNWVLGVTKNVASLIEDRNLTWSDFKNYSLIYLFIKRKQKKY